MSWYVDVKSFYELCFIKVDQLMRVISFCAPPFNAKEPRFFPVRFRANDQQGFPLRRFKADTSLAGCHLGRYRRPSSVACGGYNGREWKSIERRLVCQSVLGNDSRNCETIFAKVLAGHDDCQLPSTDNAPIFIQPFISFICLTKFATLIEYNLDILSGNKTFPLRDK